MKRTLIITLVVYLTTISAMAEYVPPTYKKKSVAAPMAPASPYIASEQAIKTLLISGLGIGESFYCPAGIGGMTFTKIDKDLFIWKWVPDFSNTVKQEFAASAVCQPTQQGDATQAAASWRWFMQNNNTPHE